MRNKTPKAKQGTKARITRKRAEAPKRTTQKRRARQVTKEART
jgi:hypothetical protein